jgi:hypothetical protein
MPIPFLAGLAIPGVAAIAAKLRSSDDKNTTSSGDDERRSREAAEAEQRRRDREKKLEAARALFKARGEVRGKDIASALDGWVKVDFVNNPAFKASLTGAGIDVALKWLRSVPGAIPGISAALVMANAVTATKNDADKKLLIQPKNDVEAFFGKYDNNLEILENIKFYSDNYNVNLKIDTALEKNVIFIKNIDDELKDLENFKNEIFKIYNLKKQKSEGTIA